MDRKKKTFDTVKMVRQIRDRHHQQLEGKSREDRLAFYREKARKLHQELDEEKRKERTR